jgi:hypothetical protein
MTLKYLLRAGFDIEVESSTRENRGFGELAAGALGGCGLRAANPPREFGVSLQTGLGVYDRTRNLPKLAQVDR